jgi:hypothetical protein
MVVESFSIPVMYDLGKTLLSVGGVVIAAYKVVQWIKDIREKDLHEIKTGMVDMHTGVLGLQTEMAKQTDALVNELKEQRQDFRTFYGPLLQTVSTPAVPRARAKRSPRPKSRKKK